MDIYINNKKYDANEKETIIQVADRNNIHIPRFCYHKRLSVVASCRMCLVEVEGAKYPQPACSTLVSQDMKINTKSLETLNAQKNTMEFLLINHPLDCPICDQAGECELQDVSLEHGDYKSSYKELKRTVIDKDMGALISTEMTRCIHCSRCVRFGEEVAGIKELGMTGRGENTKIETFINKSMTSQLSGNVIDLCPVGALNNSLYKYSARTWDLKQTYSVSSNDCLGSSIYYHTYENKIKRCIPKENNDVNLSWLSDNDRYGYEGILSEDRVLGPLLRQDDKLIPTKFESACDFFVDSIKKHSIKSSGFISAQSTCEEMLLFQKILRENNIFNIDHRSKECDFRYQDNYPIIPSFDIKLSQIKDMDNIIILGANITREFPILSVFLKEASDNKGTRIHSFATYEFKENFPIVKSDILNSAELEQLFNDENEGLSSIDINKNQNNLIIVGPSLSYLSNYSIILNNISQYAKSTNAKIALLGDQANTAGAWAMGVVPHRLPGGTPVSNPTGIDRDSYTNNNELLIFYNLEPEYDFSSDNMIIEQLKKSKVNIFFSSYMTPAIEKYADVVFPLATQIESTGSYININKTHQRFNKVLDPLGNSKDGTSILLTLANKFDICTNLELINNELKEILSAINIDNNYVFTKNLKKTNVSEMLEKIIIRNPNSSNPTLRRCESILKTHDRDNYMSLPSNKISNESEEFIMMENDKKLKLKIKQKTHDKPNNALLIDIGGTHAHKVGAYNSLVDL